MRTEKLIAALRCCEHNSCEGCPYIERNAECIGEVMGAAADKIGELVDRCARYAEEIAVLREKKRWVDVREKLPERDGHYLCRYVFGSGGKGFYGTLDYYAIDPRPHFQHEGTHGMNVTHWMDIPEVECDG